jgi:hypothetical protein
VLSKLGLLSFSIDGNERSARIRDGANGHDNEADADKNRASSLLPNYPLEINTPFKKNK